MHAAVWPEVLGALRKAHVVGMLALALFFVSRSLHTALECGVRLVS